MPEIYCSCVEAWLALQPKYLWRIVVFGTAGADSYLLNLLDQVSYFTQSCSKKEETLIQTWQLLQEIEALELKIQRLRNLLFELLFLEVLVDGVVCVLSWPMAALAGTEARAGALPGNFSEFLEFLCQILSEYCIFVCSCNMIGGSYLCTGLQIPALVRQTGAAS